MRTTGRRRTWPLRAAGWLVLNYTDADRRRAELALHGIESITQRVKVNDRNYHRVYVGPTDDLA